MLVVISPAKKLDMSLSSTEPETTQPRLLDQTAELATVCKQQSRADLKRLMKLSDSLAELNYDRFQAFADTPSATETRAAALAFRGDTYTGLDVDTLTPEQMEQAQHTLRILSGLYGVLRPRDAMQAYRLEMGTKLITARGSNLYDFWGDTLANQLMSDLADHTQQVIVNCASNEYFTAADRPTLTARVITPVFQDVSPESGPRVLGLFAKQARGAMARFMITEGVDHPDGLKDFNTGGYAFTPDASEADTWVFRRPQPEKKTAKAA